MDPLYEEEIMAEEPTVYVNPITYALQFLAQYGWLVVLVAGAALYAAYRSRPTVRRWQEMREDAEYHKDPDRVLARLEAVQRAREQQQRKLEADSERAKEQQLEREERKRQENLERLEKYGTAGGRRLGSEDDKDFLPLSGGASTSSYRPPKRSACGGGGCGR